jgi:hypothetical protein
MDVLFASIFRGFMTRNSARRFLIPVSRYLVKVEQILLKNHRFDGFPRLLWNVYDSRILGATCFFYRIVEYGWYRERKLVPLLGRVF